MIKRSTLHIFLKAFVLLGLFPLLLQESSKAQEQSIKLNPSNEKIEPEIASTDSSVFTLQYKKTDSAALDLTVFPSERNQSHAPAIIFFFGGGWMGGSTDQFKPQAEYFAQRGLTGILVNYRVSSRHGTTPFDAVEDAGDAIKFIIEHADSLEVDKDNLVLAGGSVGGHLALMSSFSPGNKVIEEHSPAALVLFNPIIDTGPDGYGYDRLGDKYKTISPVDNIPANPPPMIIFLGTDDKLIDVKQAENFCSKVKRRHGDCYLKLYQDQGHGFFNYRSTENFIKTVREADRFLNEQQLLEGTQNIRGWMQNRD